MARARGHARRRKARLTTSTLSAVMEVGGRRDVLEKAAEAPTSLDAVELDILSLLRAEPDEIVVPAVYNDASSVFTGAPDYAAARYIFGLLLCPECRSEMVYYQEREVLSAGYRFRCRVCQHELLATLD